MNLRVQKNGNLDIEVAQALRWSLYLSLLSRLSIAFLLFLVLILLFIFWTKNLPVFTIDNARLVHYSGSRWRWAVEHKTLQGCRGTETAC